MGLSLGLAWQGLQIGSSGRPGLEALFLEGFFDCGYAVLMVRIVIDTNDFVAGLRSSGGASRVVLRRALSGQYRPLFGNALWMAYQDLLGRPG